MSQKRKLALYGGSFDPVHEGHLGLLEATHQQLGIEKIVLMPCKQSPHKSRAPLASDSQRLEMCQLATQGLSYLEVSELELERAGEVSYSWMTAERYRSLYPETELYWILGTDQWEALERWTRHEYLSELVTYIVVERQRLVIPKPDVRHLVVSYDSPVSSTAIRDAFAQGEQVTGVTAEVAEYIAAHRIYQ